MDIATFRSLVRTGGRSITKRTDIIDDAAQNVIVKVLGGKKIEDDGASGYAVVSGRRAVIDILRKENKYVSLSNPKLFKKVRNMPDRKGDGRARLFSIMGEALKTLNPKEAEVVTVYLRFNWNVRKIGEHLGVEDNTAVQRFCRALRKMQTFCSHKRKEE